jgi:LAO/AO transport system kinase
MFIFTHNMIELLQQAKKGDRRALARLITLVENESEGHQELLKSLDLTSASPVVGITGPPGAGKSTLISALLKCIRKENADASIAVLAVDPSSPFTQGALLGDRLRMNEHFNDPKIFIRSLATRGALGGLSARSLEVADVLKAADFDYIFIETVGVGQSEIDIVSLADVTVVVVVPESGDDIQTIKSGIMEIADLFVVNKADRDGAAVMVKNLFNTLHERPSSATPVEVVKTIASTGEGVPELFHSLQKLNGNPDKKPLLLAHQAYRIIQHQRMKNISEQQLIDDVTREYKAGFNVYAFAERYYSKQL